MIRRGQTEDSLTLWLLEPFPWAGLFQLPKGHATHSSQCRRAWGAVAALLHAGGAADGALGSSPELPGGLSQTCCAPRPSRGADGQWGAHAHGRPRATAAGRRQPPSPRSEGRRSKPWPTRASGRGVGPQEGRPARGDHMGDPRGRRAKGVRDPTYVKHLEQERS